MRSKRAIVIGAGIGGLSAALALAVKGIDVTIVERARTPGGKMREVDAGGVLQDAGPTVFTMRSVFEELFADAGARLDDHVTLKRANILARHTWNADERLDLYADQARTAEAIGDFAGAAEARRFLAFTERARAVYTTLESPFIHAERPNPLGLTRAVGLLRLGDLLRISPFTTLWSALGSHFRDPRLRQLFGRYATYCGSSPFAAPATLMLIAHVEKTGVWFVGGGMHRLAVALADLATSRGARIRYGTEVREILVAHGRADGVRLQDGETLAADAVIVNADAGALAAGLFGMRAAGAVAAIPRSARSLSAMTWSLLARTSGFPLLRHNVFFSTDYAGEFDALFRRRNIPVAPTVYVCAHDRDNDTAFDGGGPGNPERLLCLINAPAIGDTHQFDAAEIARCEASTFGMLERCGLQIERHSRAPRLTTPVDFARLFPGTGGALYGRATHGWKASFQRPGSRTRLPGLYLAGGSAHPGPGVPMAAISGRLAAASVREDFSSTGRSIPVATRGGMSTP